MLKWLILGRLNVDIYSTTYNIVNPIPQLLENHVKHAH